MIPQGASKPFIYSYRKASEFLDEGEAASKKIDKLIERKRWNLYETYFNLLQSRYYQLTKQPEQQLRALKGSFGMAEVIGDEAYAQSLAKIIVLQAQLQNLGALNDFDSLKQMTEQQKFIDYRPDGGKDRSCRCRS